MVQAPSFAVHCQRRTPYELPEEAHARASTRLVLRDGISIAGPTQNATLRTALFLGSDVCVVVALDPVQKLLSAFGMPDMLDTEVDTLLDVPVADDLVHDDADGVWSHVVDDGSSSVMLA